MEAGCPKHHSSPCSPDLAEARLLGSSISATRGLNVARVLQSVGTSPLPRVAMSQKRLCGLRKMRSYLVSEEPRGFQIVDSNARPKQEQGREQAGHPGLLAPW